MDNPNAPKQEGSNPAPESNPTADVPNPAPEAPKSEGNNPAPDVQKPNPAPEAPNPAPPAEGNNPAPAPDDVTEGSNPAPEAPPPTKVETKKPAPKAEEPADEKEQKFNSANPDEKFNQIEQGDVVELLELAPQLKKSLIGAGWDLIGFDESAADLDISLFMLNKDDETREDGDFIFYGNEEALDGGIQHTGDSRTGAGSGDDEQIMVDFSTVPFDVVTIAVVLTIYDPENKEYSFQNVRNVYMRVEDSETERELFRYFIDEELRQVPESGGTANCMHIGNFERDANNWRFNALGKIDDGGLAKIATHYGLVIVMG